MSHYLVRAEPKKKVLDELKGRLSSGAIRKMRPFGPALQRSLVKARINRERGEVLWEEEDYCSPPLRQEREAVLDHYFDLLEIKEVDEGEGWRLLEGLPMLWSLEDRKVFDEAAGG